MGLELTLAYFGLAGIFSVGIEKLYKSLNYVTNKETSSLTVFYSVTCMLIYAFMYLVIFIKDYSGTLFYTVATVALHMSAIIGIVYMIKWFADIRKIYTCIVGLFFIIYLAVLSFSSTFKKMENNLNVETDEFYKTVVDNSLLSALIIWTILYASGISIIYFVNIPFKKFRTKILDIKINNKRKEISKRRDNGLNNYKLRKDIEKLERIKSNI